MAMNGAVVTTAPWYSDFDMCNNIARSFSFTDSAPSVQT
jgi:hypothetical protein